MMRTLAALAVSALLFAACSSATNEPCSSCPKVEGRWLMVYGAPTPLCDGGTSRTPPNLIEITRVGSSVRSTIDGVELTGTAYDTFDFTLRGVFPPGDGGVSADAGLGETVDIRAKFTQGTPDGGDDRIRGTWTGTPPPGQCAEIRDLNGTRSR